MNDSLTNRQISLMIYCIIVGYGIINLPKNAAEVAGTGGWVPLVIATIIFIFIVYMITYLQYVYEGKTLYEYSTQLVGKFVTYIFTTICILYFFLLLTMLVRMYCETIKMTILTKTPVIYLSILFYIVICYALQKGIVVIARICEIYGTISILSFIFVNSLLFTQGKVINIRPFFDTSDSMLYLKGTLKMILPFLGMEALFFIPINRKKNKNILKYTPLMMVFIGILYIYVIESTTSVVGIDSLIYHKANVFSIMRGVDVSYLEFLRRLDGIYICLWMMNSVSATFLWAYGATTFTNKIFKNIKYKHLSIIIVFVAFIVSQIPRTTEQVEAILYYNSYFGITVFLIMTLTLLLITKVKKYDKRI